MEMLANAPVRALHAGPVYATLTLEQPQMARAARPGQFLHIRCQGFPLRRPISISSVEGDTLTVIFEIKGGGTEWLAHRRPGELLDVLGPLGNGFPETEGPVLLVGGGVGVPPMYFCGQRRDADAVVAFRSRERALLIREMEMVCGQVLVMTDDGSLGQKGFAAQGAAELLARRRYGAVFACGPRIMLRTVAQAAEKAGVDCWVSLEERMGCGVGACLTCAAAMRGPDGTAVMKEVCKDGPVFRSQEVIWDG